jgi:hypothetical protein
VIKMENKNCKGACPGFETPVVSGGSADALASQINDPGATQSSWMDPRMKIYCPFK